MTSTWPSRSHPAAPCSTTHPSTTHSPLPLDTVGNYRFSTADKKWTALFRARALHSKFLPEEGKTPPRFMTGFMFANMEAAAVQREIMALMDHATNYVSFS